MAEFAKQSSVFTHDTLRMATAYDLETFALMNQLQIFTMQNAFAFTSHLGYSRYLKKHEALKSIDPMRETMLRLYALCPEVPRLFTAPAYGDFFEFAFPSVLESERTECTVHLARALGRSPSVGYRWASKDHTQHNTLHSTAQGLIKHAMSMRMTYIERYGAAGEKRARHEFWKSLLYSILVRQNRVYARLKPFIDRGVIEEIESKIAPELLPTKKPRKPRSPNKRKGVVHE